MWIQILHLLQAHHSSPTEGRIGWSMALVGAPPCTAAHHAAPYHAPCQPCTAAAFVKRCHLHYQWRKADFYTTSEISLSGAFEALVSIQIHSSTPVWDLIWDHLRMRQQSTLIWANFRFGLGSDVSSPVLRSHTKHTKENLKKTLYFS